MSTRIIDSMVLGLLADEPVRSVIEVQPCPGGFQVGVRDNDHVYKYGGTGRSVYIAFTQALQHKAESHTRTGRTKCDGS